MNLTTDYQQGVAVVHIGETRLMYPLLSEFADTVAALIASGERRIVLDVSGVAYVDSAAIGCLMDLYRQATAAGAVVRLAGVQKRVETMLSMTGAHHFLPIHPDESSAVRAFEG